MDKHFITLYHFCRNIYGRVNIRIRKNVRHSLHDTKERMDE